MPYLSSFERQAMEEVVNRFDKYLELVKYLSSVERQAMEEGLVKGLAKGREEGQAEALQKTVLRQGKLHIGKPNKQIVAAVEAITDVDRLERLTEKILQAAKWQDLLATP